MCLSSKWENRSCRVKVKEPRKNVVNYLSKNKTMNKKKTLSTILFDLRN